MNPSSSCMKSTSLVYSPSMKVLSASLGVTTSCPSSVLTKRVEQGGLSGYAGDPADEPDVAVTVEGVVTGLKVKFEVEAEAELLSGPLPAPLVLYG